jgi:NAD+ synthase (glutamine-hydrolysing)
MIDIKNIIISKLQEFFKAANFDKAVLGLSGGIDSAVVYAVAVEALGKDNVLPVLLPSMYSTSHSVDDSLEMIKNIGTAYEIIPIENVYKEVLKSLKPVFHDSPFDITEENVQARIRGLLLMAISNKQRRLLLNTSNKSELSVGYGTLYGDLCGSISVIGDLYKYQVYELAKEINKNGVIIPLNIINKAPSAELHPGQKDSDSLPDYKVLDPILCAYLDEKKTIEQIVAAGFDETAVQRTAKLVNASKFKSSQLPPLLKVF